MKIITSFLISVLLVLAIYSITKPKKGTHYEQFILSVYQKGLNNIVATEKEVKPADMPDMAALQEFVSTVDPHLGYVPVKRLPKAYETTRQQALSRDYTPPVYWNQTGADMGGRTRAMMFDPNDPNHQALYAGSVTGGLWYNSNITDANSSWEPVDDFWPDLSISSMTYDPNNPQVLYVGTGEAQTARIIYRASSGVGNGIYKSTDGGQTWFTITSTTGFNYITDLVARDEAGQTVIYAAVASGTYMGEDHVSQPSDGLFRSVDNGESWQQVLPDIPNEGVPYTPSDIEVASNGRMFVGTMENLDQKGGATILYSDSGLPGSWTVYSDYNTTISNEGYYNIPSRTILAPAPSDSNRVYAQFAAGYVNGFTYYRGRYMVRSNDGGVTWNQINIPDEDWSTLAWHAFDLKVSPTNPDRVFSGGLDLWSTGNGGLTWRHVSDWSLMYYGGGDEYVHADQHIIKYQPQNPATAVFSSDGGVFSSASANQNYPVFEQKNKGYNTLQFYSCAMNPTAGVNQFIGGLQDNGTLKYTGNPLTINDMFDGGDGAFCFWDQDDPSIYISSVYYNAYSYYRNNIQMGYSNPGTGTFISPADYDYKNNILYSNAVSFSGSHANKLFRVKGVPTPTSEQEIYLGTNSTVPFSHVKYSPYSPDGATTLFVGTQSGRLFKITHAESTPQTTELTGINFPEASISCVAIGSSENTLLVTFSNYGVSSVWLSLDGGQTWTEKEANLPDMPIRWALFHPQNDDQVLLATETGVWATNTLRFDDTEWAPAVNGMANVRVDMLKIRTSDNLVLAATHGRGLLTTTYQLDIFDGVNTTSVANNRLVVYPNPATTYVNVKAKANNNEEMNLALFDVSGKEVLSKKLSGNKNINYRLNLETLPKGIYLVKLQSKTISRQQKLVIK